MKRNQPTVLLSDSEAAALLAARLAPATCYSRVEDLVREQSLSSVTVLVVDSPRQPLGMLLVMLGRMNVEYPAMQKVALMDGPPPLPIAEYLTACGVDLVWTGSGEERIEQLAAVVGRMHERTSWMTDSLTSVRL
ncbi:MAG TPA: hypothetical protein VF021_01970 [Longimicrobiales bacterium]